jgi:hypothetical protein
MRRIAPALRHARVTLPAAIVLAYALIALLAFWPVWPGDPARIAACSCGGNKDPVQTAWFLAWTPYAILHGHNLFTTTSINVPYGANLAQNTGVPLLGLLTAPLTLAVNPIASENLLRFLAFPLSAAAMYFVVRRWTRYEPAAAVAGLFYGFSPYMVGQASVHLDLSFVPLPPIIVALIVEILVIGVRRPALAAIALGLCLAAQYYVDVEVLATTALTTVIGAALLALARPHLVPASLRRGGPAIVFAAALAFLVVAYPLYLLTHGPQRYVGPADGLNEAYNADLASLILPTSSQLVAPDGIARSASRLVGGLGGVDENGSYLGIPLILLLAYLVVRFRRHAWLVAAVVLAAASFTLSLGPHLRIDGRRYASGLPLPFDVIRHLHLLDDLLPARISLFVTFYIAIALALGLTAHHDATVARRIAGPAADLADRGRPGGERPRRRGRIGGALGVAVGALVVISLLPAWPYRSVSAAPGTVEHPSVLGAIPAGVTVLSYPYVTPSTDVAMLWQALDGLRFRLLGSYVLRREQSGAATQLPTGLKPYDIVGLFADALSPDAVPIPKVPYLAPTQETARATTIVIGDAHARHPVRGEPVVSGIVENANPRTRSFYVVGPGDTLIGVQARRSTRYVPYRNVLRPFRALTAGEHVTVYGSLQERGTIGPRRLRDLREFLQRHEVGAVVVETGAVDSAVVLAWIRAAIGPPTRRGGGADLWLLPSGARRAAR